MRNFTFIILSLAVGLCACHREKQIAAHVYDKNLTREDLQEMIPSFDQDADSIEIQQQYIDAWIVRQVMLHEAEKNLTRSEKKFDKQMQEYKEALLIDAYENKIIKKLLDTVVTRKEIMDYYSANKIDEKDTIEEADKEMIVRSILQQRKIELLKTLRKNAVKKAEDAGDVLLN
jgi:hypothetical protein